MLWAFASSREPSHRAGAGQAQQAAAAAAVAVRTWVTPRLASLVRLLFSVPRGVAVERAGAMAVPSVGEQAEKPTVRLIDPAVDAEALRMALDTISHVRARPG